MREFTDPKTGEVIQLVDGRHDEYGRERLDPTPHQLPVRVRRVDKLTSDIQRMVREEISRAAAAAEMETFEDANDFEIEDDYDPRSRHEMSIEEELDPQFKGFRQKVMDAATELFRKKRPYDDTPTPTVEEEVPVAPPVPPPGPE